MAKYSLDTITVGEVLDIPELRALVEERVPEVLEHPLLEVGRSFVFNDAIPYIEDLVTEEQLAEFKAAVEALE